MSDIVIKVENLSKQYRLGQVGTGTLSHDIKRWWYTVRGKEDPFLRIGDRNDYSIKGNSEYVWSLKNISFEIRKGEVIGFIGKNGAGKSTLLKILSQVTTPTTGTAKVKGRIASLLEVGTGFHPELSGRENIFLNGAILGMTRLEIRRKFDEIVDFSGIERYIDTPVKRYSSGMYVRLAFAVSAHLEPEILIVDEVLAVGDAEFQKKCLGKMKDVSDYGRTVLFVSHNMPSIQNLCTKCFLLKKGEIEDSGATTMIIEKYYKENSKAGMFSIQDRTDRAGNRIVQVNDFYLQDKYGEKSGGITSGDAFSFILEINNPSGKTLKNIVLAIGIDNYLESRIIHLSNELKSVELTMQPGLNKFAFFMEKMILVPGEYYATYFCSVNGEVADWLQRAISFTVEEGDYYNNGKIVKNSMGLIYADYKINTVH